MVIFQIYNIFAEKIYNSDENTWNRKCAGGCFDKTA